MRTQPGDSVLDPRSFPRVSVYFDAVKLTQEKDPQLLDTLAVAFYKNEEPEKAIATIDKALALLPIAQPGRPVHPQAAALREKLEEKLEQFKASK